VPRFRFKPGIHILDRIARLGGAGRILLDGERVSAAEARELASTLVDYSGQTENRELLNHRAHTAILDSFGDDAHARLLTEYAEARARYIALARQLEIIEHGEAARNVRVRLLEMEMAELSALNAKQGERDELSSARLRLANANRIMEEAARVASVIAGDDTLGGGARDELAQAEASARLLARYLGEESDAGEQWLALADDLSVMESGIGEVESAANALLSSLEADPFELERVQARLAEIERMALKYACAPDDLAAEQRSREYELSTLSGGVFDRADVVRELGECAAECDRTARAVTKSRTRAGGALVARVTAYLLKLDFAHSQFEVAGLGEYAEMDDVTDESMDADSESNADRTAAGGADLGDGLQGRSGGDSSSHAFQATEVQARSFGERRFRENGYDDIEFLVALNPGEPARPLARVASGGEMSRLMLAVTAALAEHTSTPVLLFDEVEAGVGGMTAQAVADVFADIARVRQVVAVTHLAQVAGRSERHIVVTKDAAARDKRAPAESWITIRVLDAGERRVELARMLGTDDPAKAELMLDEILGDYGGGR
jgi:DNA repair protein RecN (Recombination protein N)